MNKTTRLELTDTIFDAIFKMSDGNPGAISVMTTLLSEGGKIDPLDVFGGFGNILSLDNHGIYGEKIWMLFKDVCSESIELTITALRGCQLGFISEDQLLHAIDNYGEGLNMNDLLTKVKNRLGTFGVEKLKED